jgi:hypothetical protein
MLVMIRWSGCLQIHRHNKLFRWAADRRFSHSDGWLSRLSGRNQTKDRVGIDRPAQKSQYSPYSGLGQLYSRFTSDMPTVTDTDTHCTVYLSALLLHHLTVSLLSTHIMHIQFNSIQFNSIISVMSGTVA